MVNAFLLILIVNFSLLVISSVIALTIVRRRKLKKGAGRVISVPAVTSSTIHTAPGVCPATDMPTGQTDTATYQIQLYAVPNSNQNASEQLPVTEVQTTITPGDSQHLPMPAAQTPTEPGNNDAVSHSPLDCSMPEQPLAEIWT